MKKLFTWIIAVLFTTHVFAQSPEKMSYQAVIRNTANQLVSMHTVGMKISILKGSATGIAVYEETQTLSTNANGLLSLEIGSGNVISGVFANVNWAEGPFFIKTETDVDGGSAYTITGCSQLLSVPYALYAKTAYPGYLSYVSLISQFGSLSNPTSSVLYNSLNITINWTRTAQGKYTGTISPAIDVNRTTFFITSPTNRVSFCCELLNSTTLLISAVNGINYWSDDFNRVPLEIRVYGN